MITSPGCRLRTPPRQMGHYGLNARIRHLAGAGGCSSRSSASLPSYYSFPPHGRPRIVEGKTSAVRHGHRTLPHAKRFMGGAVPLSEHEQRQLEQIEQALYSDYPKLAQSGRAQDPRVHYKRRGVEAAIGFLGGVGRLLAGVISKIIPVGVGGFLVMLACAIGALTSWRHMGGTGSGPGVGPPQGAPRG